MKVFTSNNLDLERFFMCEDIHIKKENINIHITIHIKKYKFSYYESASDYSLCPML